MLLTANYINMRFLHFYTSNIATMLFTISFFIFLSNHHLYYSGIFITSVYFVSPRVTINFIIILLIFLVSKSFSTKKEKKRYFKELFKTVLISAFLFLPYLIVIYSYDSNIVAYINSYLFIFSKSFGIQTVSKPLGFFLLNIGTFVNSIIGFFTGWIPEGVYPLNLRYYQNNSIIFSIFFIFALMGLFLSRRKHIKKKNQNIFIFIKSIMILVFILYIIPPFFPFIEIYENLPFWIWVRPVEYFTLPIIIMECFFLKFFFVKTKELKKKLEFKYKKYFIQENYSKYITIENILITTLLVSSFTNYLINKQSYYPWSEDYFIDEALTNTIFFINENIPIGNKILTADLGRQQGINLYKAYYLLYSFDYINWDFSVNNSYIKTKDYILENGTEYLLVDFRRIGASELGYFLKDDNFTIIFQNTRNIIFRVG